MTSIFESAWFYWAIAVAIVLPVGLVLLTELHHALVRRQSSLAAPVALMRTYLLPLAALLVMMLEARDVPWHDTRVRLVATALGIIVLLMALSGLRATVFQNAPETSWRHRIPSIFVDVARFVLIAVGIAFIMSFVWGAHVGGLFTALGVSSIVLGLVLQNSVGQIISGLLMLFEQPFRLGDWVETPAAKGRVVEVNWRAVHIETNQGLQITPNSVLAVASFANLSRPPGAHKITVDLLFDHRDAPDEVCTLLIRVAADLPHLRPGAQPSAVPTGAAGYRASIPLRSPADDGPTRATYLRWVWYAARRAGLHLDGADDDFATDDRKQQALGDVARVLRLTPADQRDIYGNVRLTRYGADETVLHLGAVAERMRMVIHGRVRLIAADVDGTTKTVRTLETGDLLGATALTREPLFYGAVAITEVTVLEIPRDDLEELVSRKPTLLRDIGRRIEDRRRDVHRGLAAIAE